MYMYNLLLISQKLSDNLYLIISLGNSPHNTAESKKDSHTNGHNPTAAMMHGKKMAFEGNEIHFIIIM